MATNEANSLTLQSWNQIRERFDQLSREMLDFDLEVQTIDRNSQLSNDDHLRLVDYGAELWEQKSKSLGLKKNWGNGVIRTLTNAFDSIRLLRSPHRDLPLHRQCRWASAVDPDKFERLADVAGRLLFSLSNSVSSVLWQDYYTPTEMPKAPIIFWIEAVLQLSLREIPGSPLSRSAECWTWDSDWREQPKVRSTIRLPLEFITGEMGERDAEMVRLAAMRDFKIDPPFWFASLDGFLARSSFATDWIVSEIQKGEGQDEDKDTDYLPASLIIGERLGRSLSNLTKFIGKIPEDVIRRKRKGRRLKINVIDWARYWAEEDRKSAKRIEESDDLDSGTEEAVGHLAHPKAPKSARAHG